MMEKVLFGAGYWGKKAISSNELDDVIAIIDNDRLKQCGNINGIPIISLEEYLQKYKNCQIVITSTSYKEIARQLQDSYVSNYTYYPPVRRYFNDKGLIVNGYTYGSAEKDEKTWNTEISESQDREFVRLKTEEIYGKNELFSHVEVETINRCNGVCEFCPVNRKVDKRVFAVMTDELFNKIIDELSEIKYEGRIALFSNNEPLLDEKIIERNGYARRKLPRAFLHMWTNGTLLTVDKYIYLMESLDQMIIDNYNQDLKLITPVKNIVQFCKNHEKYRNKTTILMRKPMEILNSRGGFAPNRKLDIDYGDDKCILPFKQLIIRPDGKVSLCCNDPTGAYTLGDVSNQTLREIWFGDKFKKAREALYKGRRYFGKCRKCDTFNLG